MFKNIFKLITIFAAFSASVKASATLDYTKEGVLRKENECNINFVNFGIEKDISGLNVRKEIKANGTFNLSIGELKNGNVGLRSNESGYTFKDSEIVNYVKISQNGNAIDTFEVRPAPNGKFSLVVKNLSSCEGLTIKQTFKDDALMNTYLYYSNVTPDDIDHAFNIVEFGPSSNDVPYDTLSWNMNTGLDDIREKCRIYIDFHETNNVGGLHWVWYLSTDTINADKCDNPTFYDTVKKSYASMEVMDELFGDHYNGYVIKREGKENGHMDGILVDQKYLIEIYQNGCDEQNKDQVICTISSNKKLTYDEFTQLFIENCSSVIEDPYAKVEWSVDEKGVNAKFESYSLNITNYNRGALPKNENDSVSYKEFKAANSSGIARFNVSTSCGNGSYIGEKCECKPCSKNCATCTSGDSCTSCVDGYVLQNGRCEEIIITTTTTENVSTTTEVETETESVSVSTESEEPTESVSVSTENEEPTESVSVSTENEEPTESVSISTENEEPTESVSVSTENEEPTESVSISTENEEPTESGSVSTENDEPTTDIETDDGSDSDGDDAELTEAPTELGDDENSSDNEGEKETEKEKTTTVTKITTVVKPKTARKCYVKKH
ncbi:hypothetical protein H8356DRAFT_1047054 [Neocallimastix lanati (nom. inval.)]|uniref:Uncharacterized protein n=1 Tax=Neocallimastix californiae TaxID=1754190 RepID=A0A1Y2C3F5_9FUNG|nr:hypothetical protein H8356DRAFT_1047054 [Neocallimastix sp. JGI-2020a]ORY41427.1 hypothetical protein LY90DRAFT_672053 [Neocallimastix californiae]|eukprot:ORY41427.1 hypothetical protein LY90DRAFT_672053 [Neocallimastix californiae]